MGLGEDQTTWHFSENYPHMGTLANTLHPPGLEQGTGCVDRACTVGAGIIHTHSHTRNPYTDSTLHMRTHNISHTPTLRFFPKHLEHLHSLSLLLCFTHTHTHSYAAQSMQICMLTTADTHTHSHPQTPAASGACAHTSCDTHLLTLVLAPAYMFRACKASSRSPACHSRQPPGPRPASRPIPELLSAIAR